jgi:hypothetical protein
MSIKEVKRLPVGALLLMGYDHQRIVRVVVRRRSPLLGHTDLGSGLTLIDKPSGAEELWVYDQLALWKIRRIA